MIEHDWCDRTNMDLFLWNKPDIAVYSIDIIVMVWLSNTVKVD